MGWRKISGFDGRVEFSVSSVLLSFFGNTIQVAWKGSSDGSEPPAMVGGKDASLFV